MDRSIGRLNNWNTVICRRLVSADHLQKLEFVMSFPIPTILLSDARQMMERSIAAARALNVPCSIAVVDSSGHLLSFVRQDGAMGAASRATRKGDAAVVESDGWWAVRDSNPRHPRCKRGALTS